MNDNPNKQSSETQRKRILDYLRKGGTLTQLEAFAKFGCFRLASRISDLKALGYKIASVFEKNERNGKRYKRYSMNKDEQSE